MRLSVMLIGLVFLSLVSFVFISGSNEGMVALGNSDTIGQVDTQYNETIQVATQIQSALQNSKVSVPIFGDVPIISGVWKALSLLMQLGNLLQNVFGNFLSMLGVPEAVQTAIGLMLSISIMFALISAIFKRDV